MDGQYRIKAADKAAAEILIYGDIGGWDEESVTAAAFARELAQLETERIDLRVNSYGGSVADGLAIISALDRHPAQVVAHIDGLAVSMASAIVAAADQVVAADAALIMVHAPWALAVGNAADMREMAETLDRFAGSLASIYGRRVEASVAEGWVTDGVNHWLTAAEALDLGFVDSVSAVSARFSLIKPAAQRYEPRAYAIAARLRGALPMPPRKPDSQTAQPRAGERLAAFLNGRIDELETEDRSRTDIIADMAREAGIEPGTVNEILNGDINCPPIDRLRGFASALDVSQDAVIGAAEADGCDYGEDDEEASASACPVASQDAAPAETAESDSASASNVVDFARRQGRDEALAYAATVYELCALAGHPEKAADFMKAELSADEVRAKLLQERRASEPDIAAQGTSDINDAKAMWERIAKQRAALRHGG